MQHQFKKRFGQNFIRDKNLINKIIKSANIDNSNILEVGLGEGALTSELVKIANRYLGYEIDKSLMSKLQTFESDKAKIIYQDFLKDDIDKTLSEYYNNEDINLIGNLPYNITTPIIFKFLNTNLIKTATIMVQKEVGLRMVSKENVKTYNAFSVLIQYYTNIEIIMNVNRQMFFPVPKVDSVVVKLTKRNRELNIKEEKIFREIVKISFAQKRKTLVNNLLNGLDVERTELLAILDSLDLTHNIRAEALSVETFIKLTKLALNLRFKK